MRAALTVALLMLGASSRSDAIDYVALCQSSVQGTKIWISSTIDVYRKDLSAKLNDVDIPPTASAFIAGCARGRATTCTSGAVRSPTNCHRRSCARPPRRIERQS
jgi:hypothetical protein